MGAIAVNPFDEYPVLLRRFMDVVKDDPATRPAVPTDQAPTSEELSARDIRGMDKLAATGEFEHSELLRFSVDMNIDWARRL